MTEIIRLQTLLSQELARRFERVAALAFTDIVDSAGYFAQFGDEAGRRLQQLHFDLLDDCIAVHPGRVVDTAGDGAFAVFATAQGAAQAMMALHNRVSLHNQNLPRPHQLGLRIGLHWGHVLTDGVHVTGDAVNLCARLAATALPCELRLTRELFQELTPELRRLCRPLGQVSLKGIARAVDAVALLWRDPVRFPSQAVVRESGERLVLPPHDTVCFGRGETVDITTAMTSCWACPMHLPPSRSAGGTSNCAAAPAAMCSRRCRASPPRSTGCRCSATRRCRSAPARA